MPEPYSWAAPRSPEQVARDAASDRRRDRRRSWVRPHSVVVMVAVLVADVAVISVLAIAPAFFGDTASYPCSTFWADLADDANRAIWIRSGVLLGVTLLALWRRWIVVATLVVQVVLVFAFVTPLFGLRTQFTAVAEGRASPSTVDTGGVSCDSSR